MGGNPHLMKPISAASMFFLLATWILLVSQPAGVENPWGVYDGMEEKLPD
jgi:hypothetical protein